MQRRITPWSTAITIAIISGFVFLLLEVNHHDGHEVYWGTHRAATGAATLVTGFGGIARWSGRLLSLLSVDNIAEPPVWMAATMLSAIVVAWVSRSRRATASSVLVGLSTTALVLASTATVFAIGNEPDHVQWDASMFFWWVLVVALGLTPWMRRVSLSHEIALWEARPRPPDHPLPAMPELSRDARDVAFGARVVRASFDGVAGLDREARQLVWDFLQRLDRCGAEDRALLSELGLHSEPLREVLLTDQSDSVRPLLQLDAGLARFESELGNYRPRVFR